LSDNTIIAWIDILLGGNMKKWLGQLTAVLRLPEMFLMYKS